MEATRSRGLKWSQGYQGSYPPPLKGSVCLLGATAARLSEQEAGRRQKGQAGDPYAPRPKRHFIYGHMLLECARLETISYKRAGRLQHSRNAKAGAPCCSACTLPTTAWCDCVRLHFFSLHPSLYLSRITYTHAFQPPACKQPVGVYLSPPLSDGTARKKQPNSVRRAAGEFRQLQSTKPETSGFVNYHCN